MQIQRDSSYDEFTRWFLTREWFKGTIPEAPPENSHARHSLIKKYCSGKYRDWFPEGVWYISTLSEDELRQLIILDDEMQMMRREGLIKEGVIRTLENAARHAIEEEYFQHRTLERRRHHWYYWRLNEESLKLVGADRLVIRELEKGECPEIQGSRLYLQDGLGRGLPYMVLKLQDQEKDLGPVEAFVAMLPEHIR
jgi:hypothetical protein